MRAVLSLLLAVAPLTAAASGWSDAATPSDVNRDEVLVPTFAAELNGGVVVAGCGLRGAGPPAASGEITIASIPSDATVVAAILNWAILANSEPSADVVFHEAASAPVTFAGTRLGDDDSPCWLPDLSRTYGFSADVTSAMTTTGAGVYRVSLPDSGDIRVPPSAEGAALIVVYCSPTSPPRDVIVYEGIETQISGGTIQTVVGFDAATPLSAAVATFIVSDGQRDPGRESRTRALVNGAELIRPFDGSDGACQAQDAMYFDVDSVDAAAAVGAGATSLEATVVGQGDCLSWTGFVLEVATNTVSNPPGCPVAPCPTEPAADAGPPLEICAGDTVTLDASASTACSPAGLEYRWLEGATPLCSWSPAPTCVVMPAATTTFQLEVRCLDRPNCRDGAATSVLVDPATTPPDLGNTLRAVRADTTVVIGWAGDPTIASYALYRSTTKVGWPPAAFRPDLSGPTSSEPDVAAPPSRYYYRAVGVSCAGAEGP